MRRGRQAKLRAGRLLPWTIAPYGYRIHPDRPRDPALVEVDEACAAIVRELFQACADGEATLHALAVRLTTRGIASPTGRRFWSATSVRVILTNPAYMGEAISGRLQSRPSRRAYFREFVQLERLKKNSQFGANRTVVFGDAERGW